MLHNLVIGGSYKDKLFEITATLAVPANHGNYDDVILFEVSISSTNTVKPQLSDYKFYIMTGRKRIFNTADVVELFSKDNSTVTALVSFDSRAMFLYSDIQLGFFYEPYSHIEFFKIEH